MAGPVKRLYLAPGLDSARWELPLQRFGIELVRLQAPVAVAAGGGGAADTPAGTPMVDTALLEDHQLAIFLGSPQFLLDLNKVQSTLKDQPFAGFISIGSGNPPNAVYSLGTHYLDHVQEPVDTEYLLWALKRTYRFLAIEQENEALKHEIRGASSKVAELNQIGVALSAERDSDKLLSMILSKSREITNADAGSLYLVEEDPETGKQRLRFKLSQNDSLKLDYAEFTLPINTKSLAGYTAATGEVLNVPDAYELDGTGGFTFNRSFDEKNGYRTKSMVVVPMRNHREQIIGVLQLINRKIDAKTRLTPSTAVEKVTDFDQETQELVLSLGSQAAVAVQTNQLLENIRHLFEGFVNASVSAIEQRDPTTSGHSSRVAILTVGLAEAVDSVTTGLYKDIRFNSDEIREIRYASLLHDFGKVGVREHVLVKAKKLYEERLELIHARFEFARMGAKYAHLKKEFDFLLREGKEAFLNQREDLEEETRRDLQQLDDYLDTILKANEPSVLAEGSSETLQEIAEKTYEDYYGTAKPLLYPEELTSLCVKKGSLNPDERLEIESHVTHSFHFLEKIPWTPEMRNIPEIAYGHHEKLDGSGYPRGLKSEDISVGSKMMTIADIYDALTASDRPYKPAVPLGRALQILGFEQKDGHLCGELLNLFVERKVYLKTEKTKGGRGF